MDLAPITRLANRRDRRIAEQRDSGSLCHGPNPCEAVSLQSRTYASRLRPLKIVIRLLSGFPVLLASLTAHVRTTASILLVSKITGSQFRGYRYETHCRHDHPHP
jgi:hypothetical protein